MTEKQKRLRALEKEMKEKDKELEKIEEASKRRKITPEEVSRFANLNKQLRKVKKQYMEAGWDVIKERMKAESRKAVNQRRN